MKYNIGIYLRLSMKDRGYIDESNSIKSQFEQINEYLDNSSELRSCARTTYCDDGFTGTNFDRPDVKRLLEDVKSKKINCIIVKDISRFGRNYIEVGNYIEKVFPFLGVRFITATEEYDSNNPNATGDLISVFRIFFADIYSKEISAKIKAAMKKYSDEGKYMAGNVSYGYKKCEQDKRKIIVDEEVSWVVKWIFNEKLKGTTCKEIAKKLNSMNIIAPLAYKKRKTKVKNIKKQSHIWTGGAISAMVKNSVYVGDYTYNKSCREVIGNKFTQRSVPEKEWCTLKNNHEAIIDRKIFAQVNKTSKKSNKCKNTKQKETENKTKTKNIPVKCGECGRKLAKTNSKNAVYYCAYSKYQENSPCDEVRIYEKVLKESIRQSVVTHIKVMCDAKKVLEQSPTKSKLKSLENKRKELEYQRNRWTNRLEDLLKNNFDGIISDADFEEDRQLIDVKRIDIDETMATIDEQISTLRQKAEKDLIFESFFEKLDQHNEVTEQTIKDLIDCIDVYSKEEIQITWNFKDF